MWICEHTVLRQANSLRLAYRISTLEAGELLWVPMGTVVLEAVVGNTHVVGLKLSRPQAKVNQ